MYRANVFLVFVAMAVTLVWATDGAAVQEGDTSILKTVAGLLMADGKLDMQQLKELRDMIRTENTSTMQDRWKSDGFLELNIDMQTRQFMGVSTAFLEEELRAHTDALSFREDLTAAVAEEIFGSMSRLVQADAKGGGGGTSVQLQYQNEAGDFALLLVEVQRAGADLWNMKWARSAGSFVPAPDYIVVQRHKSNFFGSKDWFEIMPLQPQLTPEKIDTLFASALPQAAFFMQQNALPALPDRDEL